MSEPDHGGEPTAAVPVVLSWGRHAPDDPPPLEPAPDLATVDSETRHYRHDGWTPPLRATFLDTLARSGVVTDACATVQRSSQTAYALRNRDPIFAAGWDAALSMSRARLADELFHRAVNGTVEQIWKDGEVVAERHRHDNRLSIAVLNRLDSRCDRAERIGAPTQRVAAQWGDYLAAIAEDRVADAEALLAPPPPPPPPDAVGKAEGGEGVGFRLLRQFHQFRADQALDEPDEIDPDEDDEGPCVWVEHGAWRANYPPPDGFDGDERGAYGDDDYDRSCTPRRARCSTASTRPSSPTLATSTELRSTLPDPCPWRPKAAKGAQCIF